MFLLVYMVACCSYVVVDFVSCLFACFFVVCVCVLCCHACLAVYLLLWLFAVFVFCCCRLLLLSFAVFVVVFVDCIFVRCLTCLISCVWFYYLTC